MSLYQRLISNIRFSKTNKRVFRQTAIVRNLAKNRTNNIIGADVNYDKNQYNLTPLRQASRNGYFDVVKFLLNNAANKTISNNKGKNAIEIAKENGYSKIVELLK